MFRWDMNLVLVVLGALVITCGILGWARISPAKSPWRQRKTKVIAAVIAYTLAAGSTWYITWEPAEMGANAAEVAQTFGLKSGVPNRISLDVATDEPREVDEAIVKIDFDHPYSREGKLLLTFWYQGTPTVLELKNAVDSLSLRQSTSEPSTATFSFTGSASSGYGEHEVTSKSDCKLLIWNLLPTCQRDVTRELRSSDEVAREGLSKVVNLSQGGFNSDLRVSIVVPPEYYAKLKVAKGTQGE